MRHRFRPRPLAIVTAGVMFFLYAPLLVTISFAFNRRNDLVWPPSYFSLHWFAAIYTDQEFRSGFETSLRVSMFAALIATIIGTLSAFVFARGRGRVAGVLEGAAKVPIALPPIVIGVSLLTSFTVFNVTPSLKTVVLGLVVYVVPYVIIIGGAALRGFDPAIEEAARDLGATPTEVVQRVTLPIVIPTVICAGILAFAFAFDEILITTFTIGQQNTLPLVIASRARFAVDPSITAVATLMLVVPWIALGCALVVFRAFSVYGGQGRLGR